MIRRPPRSTLFPYTDALPILVWPGIAAGALLVNLWVGAPFPAATGIALGNTLEGLFVAHALRNVPGFTLSDRKSTRLNSSHSQISYAVFCLKKKKKND